MDGLAPGERILLFAIIGLFAAAALVRVAPKHIPTQESAPTEIQLMALYQLADRIDQADPKMVEQTALNIASNHLALVKDRLKAIELCTHVHTHSALNVLQEIATSDKEKPCLRTAAKDALKKLQSTS